MNLASLDKNLLLRGHCPRRIFEDLRCNSASGPWGSKSTGGFGTRGGWGGNPTGPGGPWGGYPIGPGRPQPPRPVFYGPHDMSGPSAFEQEYIGPESTEQEQPLFEALAGGNNVRKNL